MLVQIETLEVALESKPFFTPGYRSLFGQNFGGCYQKWSHACGIDVQMKHRLGNIE
jgi:hypothetical protein